MSNSNQIKDANFMHSSRAIGMTPIRSSLHQTSSPILAIEANVMNKRDFRGTQNTQESPVVEIRQVSPELSTVISHN